MPVLRILAIFTSVLAVFSLAVWMRSVLGRIGSLLFAPLRNLATQRSLLALNLSELVILSRALAESDRNLRVKPDFPPALTLQDKKLIKYYWSGVAYGDGQSDFEIPKDVWRQMLGLSEFVFRDLQASAYTLKNGGDEHQIVGALPQSHPSVLAWNAQNNR